jgi:hypothetical protein
VARNIERTFKSLRAQEESDLRDSNFINSQNCEVLFVSLAWLVDSPS